MSLMLSGVPCAGLAAILAASAAARLASPQFYAGLAHDACPNGLAEGLIRLSGATLIPVAAALWTLKVLLSAKTLHPSRLLSSRSTSQQIPAGKKPPATIVSQQADHESCGRTSAGWVACCMIKGA